MNTIDLHIHSNHSDGSHTPREIVRMAEKKGMKTIAIADHDTLTHIKETRAASEEVGCEAFAGVEVSADFSGGTMHLLGYFVDPDNDELFDMLDRFRGARNERNPKIIEKLNTLGCAITFEDVVREAAGSSVGRPHIARVMVRKGLVQNMEEAFQKYLAKGAPAYVNRERFPAQKIIQVIHRAGGLAFLAHPKQLNLSIPDLHVLVGQLVADGLEGIEVYSSGHTREEMETYSVIAKEYNVLMSGGSDFHGSNKPDIDMGFVGEGIELDTNMVEKMKQQHMRRKNRDHN